MTEYERLNAKFREVRDAFLETQSRAFEMMSTLLDGFGSYCQIPADRLGCSPKSEPAELLKKYSVPAATEYDRNDAWFYCRFNLMVETPRMFVISFLMSYRENKGYSEVRFKESGPTFEVYTEEKRNLLYSAMVDFVIDDLNKGANHYTQSDGALGFFS